MGLTVAIIGAGSWGTALAILLARQGTKVQIWGRPEDGIEEIREGNEHSRYLPGVVIPAGIRATASEREVIEGAEAVVFAVPSQALREVIRRFRAYLTASHLLVNTAKGLETATMLRLTEVMKQELPERLWSNIAVLSGPSHAEEVARNIPTAVVAAAESASVARRVQNIFMGPRFRVYTNPDLAGVELGGALKNIIALSAGISDGLGYGDNTRAALITRGLTEIRRLGVSMGAQEVTFFGLSGLGDLVVTCNSMHSRNRRAGILLGQGVSLPEVLKSIGMVVEGVETTLAAYRLSLQRGVSMPITAQIYEVLYGGLSPRQAVDNLMLRARTSEHESLRWD